MDKLTKPVNITFMDKPDLGAKTILAQQVDIAHLVTEVNEMRKKMGSEAISSRQVRLTVDAGALNAIIFSWGYNPADALEILSKMYGGTMGTAPAEILTEDGKVVTPDDLQEIFFGLCKEERTKNKKIRSVVDKFELNAPPVDKARFN